MTERSGKLQMLQRSVPELRYDIFMHGVKYLETRKWEGNVDIEVAHSHRGRDSPCHVTYHRVVFQ